MTIEQAKEDTLAYLGDINHDIEVLQEMASEMKDFINYGTENKIEAFESRIDELEDKLDRVSIYW